MEGRMVDIGGVALNAVVTGGGPVTVIFENGLGTGLEEWDAVVPRVAQRARVLCYDRRAASSTGPLVPPSAADMAADLQNLLTALGLQPPYVLVGHSWGGVVARVFAHTSASDVAGLVMIDATHETIDTPGLAFLPLMYAVMQAAARFGPGRRWLLRQLCPAGASPAYRAKLETRVADRALWAGSIRTARSEGAGIRASLAALRRDSPDLPPVPIRVLTAGGVSGANVKSVRRVHEAWQAAVARASTATYTNIPTSTHLLPMDAPDAVVEAIVAVLDLIRTPADC